MVRPGKEPAEAPDQHEAPETVQDTRWLNQRHQSSGRQLRPERPMLQLSRPGRLARCCCQALCQRHDQRREPCEEGKTQAGGSRAEGRRPPPLPLVACRLGLLATRVG